jgi:hypothetical protein
MISQIPQALRWTAHSEAFESIDRDYRLQLFLRWGRAVLSLKEFDRIQGESLFKKSRLLPQSAFQRFLTAPEIVCRLTHPALIALNSNSNAQFFGDALEAELDRLAIKQELSEHDVWSALGDYHRPGSVQSVTPNLMNQSAGNSSEWNPDSIFQASSLSLNIPVDFVSPFTRSQQMEKDHGPYTDFSEPEKLVSLNKFESAIEGLEQACSESVVLIKLFTRVIIGRKSLAQMGSISIPEYIGATIIANPHRTITDPLRLIEGMVHEAIHHMLYSFEVIKGPFIPTQKIEQEFQAVSPWSGRKLNPRQYVHACFVWFGLLNLWRRCKNVAAFSQVRIDESLAQASSGFNVGSLLDPLSDVKSQISVELQAALRDIQQMANATLN